jgi:hypothetical protein
MPQSLLRFSPFHSDLIPGIILLAANGLLSLWVLWLTVHRHADYGWWVAAQGCVHVVVYTNPREDVLQLLGNTASLWRGKAFGQGRPPPLCSKPTLGRRAPAPHMLARGSAALRFVAHVTHFVLDTHFCHVYNSVL